MRPTDISQLPNRALQTAISDMFADLGFGPDDAESLLDRYEIIPGVSGIPRDDAATVRMRGSHSYGVATSYDAADRVATMVALDHILDDPDPDMIEWSGSPQAAAQDMVDNEGAEHVLNAVGERFYELPGGAIYWEIDEGY